MIKREKVFVGLLCFALVLFIVSCARHDSDSTQPQETPSTPATATPQGSPLSQLETDLKYVRNGGFTYIWVFSRKDGKALDKDDAAYLRKNASQVVDWVTTDEGKKVIGGTNFDLEKGNLELLKKRFQVEDYSGR
jgi:hypothetical protein